MRKEGVGGELRGKKRDRRFLVAGCMGVVGGARVEGQSFDGSNWSGRVEEFVVSQAGGVLRTVVSTKVSDLDAVTAA